MPSAPCPEKSVLTDLLEGRLSAAEEARCEAHVAECPLCQCALDAMASGASMDGFALRQTAPSDEDVRINAIYQGGSEDWRVVLEPKPPGQSVRALIGMLGSYEIVSHLASGGMGTVFRGFDPGSSRDVAIKVLAPRLAAIDSSRRRFLREARAAASLEDEYILPIYRVQDSGPYPYIVMPLNTGGTLEDLVRSQGPLPFEEIRRIALGIAKGLRAAHAAGIIHRDLKPANILLQGDRIRLADFGLARVQDTPQLTLPGSVPGTPEFMAPEQIEGLPVNHRADLFGLGCLLQFMATGESPFQAGSVSAILRSVVSEAPAKITREQPGWFSSVLERLLEKDPDQRWQTADDVIQALQSQTNKRRRRVSRRAVLLGAAGVVLMVVGALIAPFLRSQEAPDPVAVAETGMGFDTIEEAIAQAPSGSTIILQDGLYEIASALTLFQPLRFEAAKKAQPVLRSLAVDGKIFDAYHDLTLDGLTLRHTLRDLQKSRSLVQARQGITVRHCHLEQIWKGAGKPVPFPAAIYAWGPVDVSHTVIDATSGCAIFLNANETGEPVVPIRVEHSAIAAVRGFFLTSPKRAVTWDIQLRENHIVAGAFASLGDHNLGVADWDLTRCRIEAASMLMVRDPWVDFLAHTLPRTSWDGRGNVYSMTRFVWAWEGRPNDPALLEDLAGWLQLCPQASEINSHQSEALLFLDDRPQDYRALREHFKSWLPITGEALGFKPNEVGTSAR